jgi:hypothetical protein
MLSERYWTSMRHNKEWILFNHQNQSVFVDVSAQQAE